MLPDFPSSSQTQRPWRKRRLFALGVGLCLLAGLAALLVLANSSLSLNVDKARSNLELQLQQLTGQAVSVAGETSFELLPRPVVRLSDVRIGSADDKRAMTVTQVVAQFNLLDALVGRSEVSRLTLIRPELDTRQTPVAAPSEGPGGQDTLPEQAQVNETSDMLTSYLRSFFERFDGIRRVELRDGLFRFQTGGHTLSSVNIDLDWPGKDRTAELAGSFVWNGQSAELNLQVSDPAKFLEGQTSPLRMTMSSPLLDIGFNGNGAYGNSATLEGRLRVSTPSPTRAARWLDLTSGPMPELGALQFETNLNFAENRAKLEEAKVNLGQTPGRGAIELRFHEDAKTELTGTIAFEELDLAAVGNAIAPLPTNILNLQRRINWSFVQALNMDLRLSARTVSIAELQLQDLAATVKFANGTAILDLGDAVLAGGRAQARFTLPTESFPPVLKGKVNFQGVDASVLSNTLSNGAMRLSGITGLVADVEIPVTDWQSIVQGNSATIDMTIVAGAAGGLPAIVPVENNSQEIALQQNSSPVSFEKLEARLTNAGTATWIDALRVETATGRFDMNGVATMGDESILLDGAFWPEPNQVSDTSAAFTSSKPIEFNIQGKWPTPELKIAPRSTPM
ncbi:hypothetical protein FPY71_01425 [Aureimonas fodinaquatilis]|uniref:AsmA family protein n=1 Tax=Aureimonas fodinaquatilis TaxID=2565783 RepID=A0A5B0E1H6_9HYPH|nr:hypothetical protein [Aureimonas fodinaquatilis]KAA0971821.1 hypothetical protein FPY71_01425 [Aureimonas fodinaquatilis]